MPPNFMSTDVETPSASARGLGRFKRPSGLLRSFSTKGMSSRGSSTDSLGRPGSTSGSSDGMSNSAFDAASLVAAEFNANNSLLTKVGEDDAMTNFPKHSSSGSSSSSDDDDGDCGSLDDSKPDNNAPTSLSTIVAELGPSPSPEKLSEVAGNRAKEQLEKCLSKNGNSILCRDKFNSISEYTKANLDIGILLGKGSFSDAFEITLNVPDDKPRASSQSNNEDLDIDAIFANLETKFSGPVAAPRPPVGANGRRPAAQRHNSICMGSARTPISRRNDERSLTLVMKCLRPQIRSDAEKFLIGVEDLIHETAMLASLDHPNIVKLHGRASGDLSSAFKVDDGYFILLDRLKDTLDERITRWQKTSQGDSLTVSQLKVACALASAMDYLHSNNIIYRDLKPANVGFDSCGVLKLFDFGFAIGITPPPEDYDASADKGTGKKAHLLYEKCGTPRYMAPEVGLSKGYGIEADVYSFGILSWEIFSMIKPFAKIKSAKEFHNTVFVKGERPKAGKNWPKHLKETTSLCWSTDPEERPTMAFVKSMLTASVRDMLNGDKPDANLRKSKMFKRLTWDA